MKEFAIFRGVPCSKIDDYCSEGHFASACQISCDPTPKPMISTSAFLSCACESLGRPWQSVLHQAIMIECHKHLFVLEIYTDKIVYLVTRCYEGSHSIVSFNFCNYFYYSKNGHSHHMEARWSPLFECPPIALIVINFVLQATTLFYRTIQRKLQLILHQSIRLYDLCLFSQMKQLPLSEYFFLGKFLNKAIPIKKYLIICLRKVKRFHSLLVTVELKHIKDVDQLNEIITHFSLSLSNVCAYFYK